MASFHISPTRTRVGIVLFSSRAYLVCNFRRYRNKNSLLLAISRIRYPRGGTKIGRALRFTRQKLFTTRSSVRKVSMLLCRYSCLNTYPKLSLSFDGIPVTRTRLIDSAHIYRDVIKSDISTLLLTISFVPRC